MAVRPPSIDTNVDPALTGKNSGPTVGRTQASLRSDGTLDSTSRLNTNPLGTTIVANGNVIISNTFPTTVDSGDNIVVVETDKNVYVTVNEENFDQNYITNEVNNVGGGNGYVQFNNAGSFAGDSEFTFNTTTKVLSVGGVSTDNLLYANGDPWSFGSGNGTPGGLNGEIQFNDGGDFNGVPGVTWANAKFNLGVLGNLSISGGSNGQVLTTNGNGILSWSNPAGSYSNNNVANYLPTYTGNVAANWVQANYVAGNGSQLTAIPGANVSGTVPYAAVANSVAVGNVSGLGNIATINKDGNSSNILYGNGVFAASPSVSLSGDGGNLSNINGANVSGTVANADFSERIAVEAVNNNYSYHVVLTTGPGDSTLHNDIDDSFQYNPADGILTVTRVDTDYLQVSQSVLSNLVPFDSLPLNLGSNTNRWQDLYLSNSTIYLGDATISANGNSIVVDSITTTTDNEFLIETSQPPTEPPTTIVISGADFSSVNTTYNSVPASSPPQWVPAVYTPGVDPYIEFSGGEYGIFVPGFGQALYVNTGTLNVPLAQWNTNPPLGSVAPTGVYTYSSSYNYTWTFGQDGNLTLPGNTFAVNYANGTQVPIGGGSGYTIQYTVGDFVANTTIAGTSEIQFCDNEGGNATPGLANKMFIAAGSSNEQNLGDIFLQWANNSYRGTISLNDGTDQLTMNISDGMVYRTPQEYRGFYAGLNQVWGDDCSINQLIITNSAPVQFYNTDFLVEDDVFHATNLGAGNTHVMLNVYGSSEFEPINPQYLWNLFTSFVDNVLYDGGATLTTDVSQIRAQFYNNNGGFRNTIPAEDYYQWFEFASGDDYYSSAPVTGGTGNSATLRVRLDPSEVYTVLGIGQAGSGYTPGDTLVVLGTDLGGTSPVNDLTVTVSSVDGTGGVTGVAPVTGVAVYPWPSNYIDDGGDDQYDTANYINTNIDTEISYANGVAQTSVAAFGNGDYCVMYNESMFCMVTTNANINELFYSGNLGSDGDGWVRWTGLVDFNNSVNPGNAPEYAYFNCEFLDGGLTVDTGNTYNVTLDSAGINLDEYYAYFNNNNNDYYFGSNNTWRLESQQQLYVQSYDDMYIRTMTPQRGTGIGGSSINIDPADGTDAVAETNTPAQQGGSVNITAGNGGDTDNIDALGAFGGSVNISGGLGTGNAQAGNINIYGGEGANAGSINLSTDFGSNSSGKVKINTYDGNSTKIWEFRPDGSTIYPTLSVARGDTTGGSINGFTLNGSDGSQEFIITTPDGDPEGFSSSSQRIVINPGKGGDSTSGEGGDIYLWAGRGGDSGGSGGDIKIRGGQGMGAGGAGGYIRMEAGDGDYASGATPGYIELRGGEGGTGQVGGNITITSGTGGNGGGYANITGGYAYNGQGGNVNITGGGSNDGLGSYGNINIIAGASTWRFDNSGNLTLPKNINGLNNGSPIVIDAGVTGNSYISIPSFTDGGEQLVIKNDYPSGQGIRIQTETGNFVLSGNSITFPDSTVQNTAYTGGGGGGNTGNVTFNDVTVQGVNGLNLSAGADFTANLAYLQVRSGDVVSHIHLDTGNNEAYDLIVGNDQKFVQVSSTGNIIMSSYDGNISYTMTLDNAGNLVLPTGGKLGYAGMGWTGLTGAISGTPVEVTSYTNNGNISTQLFLNNNGTLAILAADEANATSYTWNFDSNGNFSVPSNILVSGVASPAPYISGFSSITLVGTGTVVNASSGNILTNEVTGTKFNFLNGSYTATITGSGAAANYSLNLPANAGSNGQVLSTDGAGNLSWISAGGGGVAEASFSIQSANFNAVAGSRYGVNTSGGAVTATLPASPATGAAIFFADAGGAYASNNLTIARNGQTIMGAASDLTVSTNNQSVGLFFNGTTWRTYNAG